MSRNVALARVGVTETQLTRWKREPEFLLRWNVMARERNLSPVRLEAPRVASTDVVRRVLAAFEEDPQFGLTAACRAAGTTTRKVIAAVAADPHLQDLYDRAMDGLVEPIEQNHIQNLERPTAYSQREKFLRQNGGSMWGDNTAREDRPLVVHGNLNVAVLQEVPKARQLEDGRHVPLDIPVQRLTADDALPSMTGGKE